jgi:hypothetical protein
MGVGVVVVVVVVVVRERERERERERGRRGKDHSAFIKFSASTALGVAGNPCLAAFIKSKFMIFL